MNGDIQEDTIEIPETPIVKDLLQKPIKYLDYIEPLEEPLEISTNHLEHKKGFNSHNLITNADAEILFNKLLDDPTIPLWRNKEMYAGIMKDCKTLSTAELAQKYCTSETSVLRIIKYKGYQPITAEELPKDKAEEIIEFMKNNRDKSTINRNTDDGRKYFYPKLTTAEIAKKFNIPIELLQRLLILTIN